MNRSSTQLLLVPAAVAAALVGLLAVVSIVPGSAAPAAGAPATGPQLIDLVAVSLDSAPAGEQAAIADGIITIEEYTTAVEATVACAAAAGATASIIPAVGLAPPGLTFTAPSLEAAERTRSVLADCQAQHFDQVDLLWAAAHRATSEEQVAAAARWVDSCAAESLSAGAASDGTIARGMCVRKHYETFGYWP